MTYKSFDLNLKQDNIINFLGDKDANLRYLEQFFNCDIVFRDNQIKTNITEEEYDKFYDAIKRLEEYVNEGKSVDETVLKNILKNEESTWHKNLLAYTSNGKPIYAKTYRQSELVKQIENNDITFAIGPAGTGKTFLAVAMAVNAFKSNDVDKIVLTRPAVEAGESLGFLPGDLKEKVDPYLMPLYDSLRLLLGDEQANKLQEKGSIEVIPLAYMRGRTLSRSFIILDEAQNTTDKQMLMFLTRLGDNSKIVVTGDVTQIDLKIPAKQSGLVLAREKLKNINDIGFVEFDNEDVVRHPLVEKIVKAYTS